MRKKSPVLFQCFKNNKPHPFPAPRRLDAARIAQSLERQGIRTTPPVLPPSGEGRALRTSFASSQASWFNHLVEKVFATFQPRHLNILHSRIRPNCCFSIKKLNYGFLSRNGKTT
jgi:hypothetical protein